MAWGGGVFTRTYGSTAWQIDASNAVGIVPDRHDTNDQDLADGINACINKAGGNTPTADLPMGGYKHTNLAAGSAAAPTFCAGNDQDTGMYTSGANTLNFATGGVERFRIDSSGNSLCLGILRLAATGGEGGELRIRNAANADNFILDCGPGDVIRYLNSNNTDQYWENNSVEAMRLTAAGNLGIGATPASRLLVSGGSDAGAPTDAGVKTSTIRISSATTAANTGGAIEFGAGQGVFAQTYFSAIKGLIQDGTANTVGDLAFYTRSLTSDSSLTERMRLTSAGKLGIGVTPTTNLEIQASDTTVQLNRFSNDNSSPRLNLRKSRSATVGTNTIVNDGDGCGIIAFQGANGTTYNELATITAQVDGTPGASNDMPGRLVFRTTADGAGSTTERMRITSAGNVGIGNTNPQSLLDVGDGAGQKVVTCSAGNSGTAGGSSFWCRNGGVTESAFGGWSSIVGGVYDGTTTVWAAGAMRFVSGGGSNERITLTSGGNVGIGGINPSYLLQLQADSAAKPTSNTWTIASDERIKTNIQPYTKGLEAILQVEPITYDYNGKGGMAAGPGGISIVAQTLQPVFPECIGSFKGKLNEDDAEETDILNYNGHAMTFALINAVKELSTKLDDLTERMEALEA